MIGNPFQQERAFIAGGRNERGGLGHLLCPSGAACLVPNPKERAGVAQARACFATKPGFILFQLRWGIRGYGQVSLKSQSLTVKTAECFGMNVI